MRAGGIVQLVVVALSSSDRSGTDLTSWREMIWCGRLRISTSPLIIMHLGRSGLTKSGVGNRSEDGLELIGGCDGFDRQGDCAESLVPLTRVVSRS